MNNRIRDPNDIFADACRLFAANAYAECESVSRQLLSLTPIRIEALVLLGGACATREAFDALDDAYDAYRKVQALVLRSALPFTRLTCLEWPNHFGPCAIPRLAPPESREFK